MIGGTPGNISRHPSVPRHPGWEPLVYRIYSRISRGFLDTFSIKKSKGRGIKVGKY
jgi:hypothetical protein